MSKQKPKPIGDGWRKCPSVTYGGKPYFWFRRFNEKRQWFIWNHQTKTWQYEEEALDGKIQLFNPED